MAKRVSSDKKVNFSFILIPNVKTGKEEYPDDVTSMPKNGDGVE